MVATFRMPMPGEAEEVCPRSMLDFFHKNGYLVIENGLDADRVAALSADVLRLDAEVRSTRRRATSAKELAKHHVLRRFFEQSASMVDVVRSAPIVDLVQCLIADVPGARPGGNGLRAHLLHNNAFSVPPGGRGQAPSWHTDDALQQIILAPGAPPLPDSVRLPVLAVTCMCWLSDCVEPANGPTFVVPGSHRFGRAVDGALAERRGVPCVGPAGTVVIVNNQTWHRGCANTSEVPRVCMQMTFGRRMMGHKFGSIMNYQMPSHVLTGEAESDQTRERFGFLEGGAYS